MEATQQKANSLRSQSRLPRSIGDVILGIRESYSQTRGSFAGLTDL
jgi:hypothetical protein